MVGKYGVEEWRIDKAEQEKGIEQQGSASNMKIINDIIDGVLIAFIVPFFITVGIYMSLYAGAFGLAFFEYESLANTVHDFVFSGWGNFRIVYFITFTVFLVAIIRAIFEKK